MGQFKYKADRKNSLVAFYRGQTTHGFIIELDMTLKCYVILYDKEERDVFGYTYDSMTGQKKFFLVKIRKFGLASEHFSVDKFRLKIRDFSQSEIITV